MVWNAPRLTILALMLCHTALQQSVTVRVTAGQSKRRFRLSVRQEWRVNDIVRAIRERAGNLAGRTLVDDRGRVMSREALREHGRVWTKPSQQELRGWLYHQRAQRAASVEVAINEWRAATEADPPQADHHIELCKALRRENRLVEALGAVTRAAALLPRSDAIALQLAQIQYSQGSVAAAIGSYNLSATLLAQHGPEGPAPCGAAGAGLVARAALKALQHPIPFQCPPLPTTADSDAGLVSQGLEGKAWYRAHVYVWRQETRAPEWLQDLFGTLLDAFTERSLHTGTPLLFVTPPGTEPHLDGTPTPSIACYRIPAGLDIGEYTGSDSVHVPGAHHAP